jgi:ATP-dependent DNA helicase RecG
MGTGTADMIRIAKEHKLQEPVFEQDEDFKIVIYRPSSDQVSATDVKISEEIQSLLKVMKGEMNRKEILHALVLKHIGNFRENYLEPTLKVQLIERIYPNNPNNPRQKYRLTEKGLKIKGKIKKH